MIDTIKIVSMINKKTYEIIRSKSIIKTAFQNSTGEVFYKIINDSLQGTYNSNISVRIGEGIKYRFPNMYYIEIEGSYHKFKKGFNSHNGYYNIVSIAKELIELVKNYYHITLPNINHWFLQRIDIAICYDLNNQDNIKTYINNLSLCNYPRRKLKHYEGESIYLTGSTTTLKIYNKKLEFIKHDLKNFQNTDFNLEKYLEKINGFIRFECEIKKKKLKNYYHTNYIRINHINYQELKEIWYQEFSKLLKNMKSDLEIVREKEKVKNRIHSSYEGVRAKNLFNFYLLILVRGIKEVKQDTNKSMFYKNIADLKKINIDFSQKMDLNLTDNSINFNPFEQEEIL